MSKHFILSLFVEVNQHVAKPGTSGEGASTPEASDSPSSSGSDAAGPPEPETNASISKCSMDQAAPSPEQPPTLRHPFNEDPLAAAGGYMLMVRTVTFQKVMRSYSNR